MLEYLLKGILIGICVSAPVGPIGVLCIQRTLNKGRYHGIVTGLGATTSDIIYALIAVFCLNFVVDFIEAHQFIIQLFGSFIVIIFGLYIFRSNPVKQLNGSSNKKIKNNLVGDYATAFALCISNPLILFLFIGLFARLHFFNGGDSLWQTIIGIFSILIGALLWWILLNGIVDKFRKKINIRGLWLVNKVTGSLILLLGILGFIYSFAA